MKSEDSHRSSDSSPDPKVDRPVAGSDHSPDQIAGDPVSDGQISDDRISMDPSSGPSPVVPVGDHSYADSAIQFTDSRQTDVPTRDSGSRSVSALAAAATDSVSIQFTSDIHNIYRPLDPPLNQTWIVNWSFYWRCYFNCLTVIGPIIAAIFLLLFARPLLHLPNFRSVDQWLPLIALASTPVLLWSSLCCHFLLRFPIQSDRPLYFAHAGVAFGVIHSLYVFVLTIPIMGSWSVGGGLAAAISTLLLALMVTTVRYFSRRRLSIMQLLGIVTCFSLILFLVSISRDSRFLLFGLLLMGLVTGFSFPLVTGVTNLILLSYHWYERSEKRFSNTHRLAVYFLVEALVFAASFWGLVEFFFLA